MFNDSNIKLLHNFHVIKMIIFIKLCIYLHSKQSLIYYYYYFIMSNFSKKKNWQPHIFYLFYSFIIIFIYLHLIEITSYCWYIKLILMYIIFGIHIVIITIKYYIIKMHASADNNILFQRTYYYSLIIYLILFLKLHTYFV